MNKQHIVIFPLFITLIFICSNTSLEPRTRLAFAQSHYQKQGKQHANKLNNADDYTSYTSDIQTILNVVGNGRLAVGGVHVRKQHRAVVRGGGVLLEDEA